MAESTFIWEPITVLEAVGIFESLDIPWWVAGGEAIDLFVGRATRLHGDIDLAVLRRDTHQLRTLRNNWDVHIAHNGELIAWDGGPLADDMHQFWVRHYGAEAWAFEVLLEYTDGDDWLFRRDHRVRRAIATIGRQTPSGVPFLAPEICLLYKARHTDVERNALDFEVAVSLLDDQSQQWLAASLQVAAPGHPWIERLGER